MNRFCKLTFFIYHEKKKKDIFCDNNNDAVFDGNALSIQDSFMPNI